MLENKVSVIIPAYNEELYIKNTIIAVLNWSLKVDEIIVVDDGSSDETNRIIDKLKNQNNTVKLVKLQNNLGKGKALVEGIKKAKGNILMFLDADLGKSAIYAEKLLFPVLSEESDMTVAILPKAKKKAGIGLVKILARKGIFFLTGSIIFAPLSGQRAIKKEIVEQLPIFADGFGIEVGLTIDVLRKGCRIDEIEIPLQHRETGRSISDVFHRGKEFCDISKTLYKKWRYQ